MRIMLQGIFLDSSTIFHYEDFVIPFYFALELISLEASFEVVRSKAGETCALIAPCDSSGTREIVRLERKRENVPRREAW